MDPEYQKQAERLEELRRSLSLANNAHSTTSSSGSSSIITTEPVRHFVDERAGGGAYEKQKDPLIFHGLYSPSGIDIMSILIHVYQRPNPKIHIGNVDSAVALVVVDTELPDMPLIYCSETVEALTGYTNADILGKNCRFLQHPPGGKFCQDERVNAINMAARQELRGKLASNEEARVRLLNFRKDGSIFANLLTTIPIVWNGEDGSKKNYIVGFQADEGRAFL